MSIDASVTAVLVSGALAAAGWAGQSLYGTWRRRKRERTQTAIHLSRLMSLLNTASNLFDIQQEQVRRLEGELKRNHPAEYGSGNGYDDELSRLHHLMTESERSLHEVIRGYTEHSMRTVNQAMTSWLNDDTVFKTGGAPVTRPHQLAARLSELELHLLLWHAKFRSWIPGHQERALVYMDDEKAHGLGFPRATTKEVDGKRVPVPGVDEEVATALDDLRRRWG